MVYKQDILTFFEKIEVDPSWAFASKTRKDTAYITHGYHRYPAKFIPQIVARLAEKYTKKGDLIVDPFGGGGTTLVESKVLCRPSIGIDVNPVAVLITKAKKTPLDPVTIQQQFFQLREKINAFDPRIQVQVTKHDRIDYWFHLQEKTKLAFLFSEISKIGDHNIRIFFYCGFSNILKNCSIWLQKSNKPTRDLKKVPADPFTAFFSQVKVMLRRNTDFFNLLQETKGFATPCEVYCTDAKNIPVASDSVSLIVTSPPYVTSYEYADLHQLTAFWFEFTTDLNDFRKRFIGSTSYHRKDGMLNSEIAKNITEILITRDRKTALEVATYFSEMNQVFGQMKRVLKKGGRACIVIGNTSLKGVEIFNAEVFVEQLLNLGFRVEEIIKREVLSKNLPSTRDTVTGRFAKITDKYKVLAYPIEYILVMQKI